MHILFSATSDLTSKVIARLLDCSIARLLDCLIARLLDCLIAHALLLDAHPLLRHLLVFRHLQ
eukprot:6176186-Prymnesium_polylepis.1